MSCIYRSLRHFPAILRKVSKCLLRKYLNMNEMKAHKSVIDFYLFSI